MLLAWSLSQITLIMRMTRSVEIDKQTGEKPVTDKVSKNCIAMFDQQGYTIKTTRRIGR